MKIEIERVPDGRGGQRWKVTAPEHSTYHVRIDDVNMVVGVIMKLAEKDELHEQ